MAIWKNLSVEKYAVIVDIFPKRLKAKGSYFKNNDIYIMIIIYF